MENNKKIIAIDREKKRKEIIDNDYIVKENVRGGR
jgi:hypothetical protein